MKKNLFFAAAMALAAFGMSSCNNEDEEFSKASQSAASNEQMEQLTFPATASISCGDEGLSKVALSSGGTTLMFSPHEAASVDLLNASNTKIQTVTFTGDNDSPSPTTNFSGTVYKLDFANTSSLKVTIPSSAVSNGVMTIPSTQTLVENGFDPKAFIATATISDKTNLAATFSPQVALLKIETCSAQSNVTVNGKGICGPQGSEQESISIGNIAADKIYYVAVWPKAYTDGITIKAGDKTLKTISSATLAAGKYYKVNLFLTLSDLNMATNIPSSATSVVFDYKSHVSSDILNWSKTKINSDVTIYNNGTSYYVLSDLEICMKGSLAFMFYDYRSLVNVEFNNFNTAEVTSLNGMFYHANAMTNVKFTDNFITSKVTDNNGMFLWCSSLETIELPRGFTFGTCNQTFAYCGNLTKIVVSTINTDNMPTNEGSMFLGSTKLVGGQNSAQTTYGGSSQYARIDGGASNPGYFTERAFLSLSDLNMATNIPGSKATSVVFDYKSNVSSDILNWSKTTINSDVAIYNNGSSYYVLSDLEICMKGSLEAMFKSYSSLTNLQFNNFNTTEVTNMREMFRGTALVNIDVSGFNTSNVEDMEKMFVFCSSLKSIRFSDKFTTSNVTNMSNMFAYDNLLESIELPRGFDFAPNCSVMFACGLLQKIYVYEDFKTNRVTNSVQIFNGATSLVGGNGTKASDVYVMNAEGLPLMHIDVEGNPGLFTNIADKPASSK